MKNTTDFYRAGQDGSNFQTEIQVLKPKVLNVSYLSTFFCKESQHQTAHHNKLWIPEAAKPSKKWAPLSWLPKNTGIPSIWPLELRSQSLATLETIEGAKHPQAFSDSQEFPHWVGNHTSPNILKTNKKHLELLETSLPKNEQIWLLTSSNLIILGSNVAWRLAWIVNKNWRSTQNSYGL